MGLLDEAIREHLELKRQHGADPAEVAQLEREAFGPARRGPEPLEVPPPADEAEPVDPVLVEPEVDAPDYEPPVEAEPLPEPPRTEALRAEPEPEPVAEDLAYEDAATEEQPPAPAPEGEDVLEETPEFLQETPEHDRLWFEQRPPRDFDFDG